MNTNNFTFNLKPDLRACFTGMQFYMCQLMTVATSSGPIERLCLSNMIPASSRGSRLPGICEANDERAIRHPSHLLQAAIGEPG